MVEKIVGSIFNWNEIGCRSGGNTNHFIFMGNSNHVLALQIWLVMFPTVLFLVAEVVGNPTVLFWWQVQPNFQVGNVVGNFQLF